MSDPALQTSSASGPLWAGCKLVVLVVGGAIAFMPDELRPVARRLFELALASDAAAGLLMALGAVAACLVGLTCLGQWLLPGDADLG